VIEIAKRDHASQEAARMFTPPASRPGSLVSSDTTPHYSTTVY
jgi:hypothetical protein